MSQTAQATGLSEKTRDLLNRMLNSGQSEQVYIAQALDEIAGNGGEQADDSHLLTCAIELKSAAMYVTHELRRRI